MDKTTTAEKENKSVETEVAKGQSLEVQNQLVQKLNEIKSVEELSAMEFNQPAGLEDYESNRQV